MVWGVAELFRASAQHTEHRSRVFAATAADPGDIEAEGLGADDVEAVRRDEEHFLLRNAEHRLDEGVTGPVRLVNSDAVDADRGFDPPIQPRVPDEVLQHSPAAVREELELT